jgi:hypothetical protein
MDKNKINAYLCLNLLNDKIITCILYDYIDKENYLVYNGYSYFSEFKEHKTKNQDDFKYELKKNFNLSIKINNKDLFEELLKLNFKEDVLNKNKVDFLGKFNLHEWVI